MKKLATVLLAVSLAVSSVAPVLAKDRITDPNKPSLAPGTVIYPVNGSTGGEVDVTSTSLALLEAAKGGAGDTTQGKYIFSVDAEPDKYEDPAVTKVVKNEANGNIAYTIADALEDLSIDPKKTNFVVYSVSGKTKKINPLKYDFANVFSDLVYGTATEYGFDGVDGPFTIELKMDLLKNLKKKDLKKYKIMVISQDPKTGANKVSFSKLQPKFFNKEAGTIKVTVSGLGTYVLVKK